MADNLTTTTTVSTIPSGTVISTDDAGASGHVQRVKLAYSADGVATHATVDADGVLVNLGANNDVTVTGTVAVTQSGTWDEVGINDSGNSITVDNAALSVTGGGAEATALRVTVASDSTGVLSVDDNGGSLTVDGTVAVSGTVAVTQSGTWDEVGINDSGNSITVDNGGTFAVQESGGALTALQIIDDWDESDRAKVNPIVGQAGVAAGAGAVGATVQRVTLASDDPAVTALQILDNAISGSEMQVDVVGALPAGTNNIGDVDVLTVPTDPFGANADAASASGSISAKLRFIASTGIPVTGTVTVGSHAVTNAGTFAVQASRTKTNQTAASPTTATVNGTSGSAVSSNGSRTGLHVKNTSTSGQRISLNLAGGSAVLDSGVTLNVGEAWEMDDYCFTTAAITAIASAASGRLSVQEFS